MINHHPNDELLQSWAAGHLDPAAGLVLSVHCDGCQNCRERVQVLLATGGVCLDEIEPVAMGSASLEHTLTRATAPRTRPVVESDTWQPARPMPHVGPLTESRALRGCTIGRWRWIAAGIRYSRIALPHSSNGKTFLLRIAPGKSLPRHSHGAMELTQVLSGRFDDGRATFVAGDFDETNQEVTHRPVVAADGECLCLAYLESPLRFDGWIRQSLARIVGL
ncbi:MAG: ChrR family anti-sigma-E factor [Steroidobacteraceae bacterium]